MVTTKWYYRWNAAIGAPIGVGKSLITKRLIGRLSTQGVCAYIVTASPLFSQIILSMNWNFEMIRFRGIAARGDAKELIAYIIHGLKFPKRGL